MSNNVGKIRGSSVNGRSSIKIDSSNVDITGNLLAKGFITFSQTNEELAYTDPSGIIYRFNSLDNSVNSLLTSNNDACFNNVDVSGSLNVQGEKVMTVPALDICGNDLSANTTYEITTGPPGSINNISFVKKQPEYILSAAKNGNQDLANSQFIAITNWTVLAQKNSGTDFNTTSGVWTCPASGLYEVYFDGHFIDDDQDRIQRIIIQIMSGTNVIKQKQIRFQSGNLNEDAEKLCLDTCTIRNILQGDEISFLAHLTVSGSNNTGQCAGSNNSYTRTEINIQRVG